MPQLKISLNDYSKLGIFSTQLHLPVASHLGSSKKQPDFLCGRYLGLYYIYHLQWMYYMLLYLPAKKWQQDIEKYN